MKINYGYIRAENRTQYESLMLLKDNEGHYALTSAHRKIVDYIGSMPREAGCFATDYMINEQSIRAKTRKTLRRHLQYLLAIKAISRSIENGKRVFRIMTLLGKVPSQKTFRTDKGMSEYSYARTSVAQKQITEVAVETGKTIDASWFEENDGAVFFEQPEAKFASEPANLVEKEANFAPILYKDNNNSKEILPPKGSLVRCSDDSSGQKSEDGKADVRQSKDGLLAVRADAADRGRQHAEGPKVPQKSQESFSGFQEVKDDDWSEPLILPKKKGRKKHPSLKERKADAAVKHAAGHVVNPLGITNNKPRKLCPKAARDIEPTGSVTVPKLYRHLIKKFDEAFGEGIISQMLPDDKTAVQIYFDGIRQKFIDSCKYDPTYRDISEYFDWFLDPAHVAKVLSVGQFQGKDKGSIHFKQMAGMAYIRKFYDQFLKSKVAKASVLVPATDQEKISRVVSYVSEAFKEMEHTCKDSSKFVISMHGHGCAMVAQFLHETKGMTAEECRSRIIFDMAEYLGQAVDEKDRKDCLECLDEVVKHTFMKRKLIDEQCVWFDLEKHMNGLVEEAIRKENGNRAGTAGAAPSAGQE